MTTEHTTVVLYPTTGEPQPIRFRGRELARQTSERPGRLRWWAATVYEVDAPSRPSTRYVIALRGCSSVPGEIDSVAVHWFQDFRSPAALRFLDECSRRGAHVVTHAVREAGLLPVRDLSDKVDS